MSEQEGILWLPQLNEVGGVPEPIEGRFLGDDGMSAPEFRIALVESVDRLNPYGLDEGLMRCDRAVAYLAAGQRERASELLDGPEARTALAHLAERVLGTAELDTEHLARHIMSTRLSPSLQDLVNLVTLGQELPGGAEFSAIAAELRVDLRMRQSHTFANLSTPLSRWIEVPGIGNYKAPVKLLRQRIDLRAVPSRLFQWNGADKAEIEAAPSGNGARVRIPLRRPPTGTERLRLFAADREGRLVADEPLMVQSDHLVALLKSFPSPLQSIYLGVYSEHLDAQALALRASGPAVDAERLLVQSWTSSRFGLATSVALEAERATRRRDSDSDDDPLLVKHWLQEAPTARATSAAARDAALTAGSGDRQVVAETFTAYNDRRAWDLRTTSTGPARPLLSELAHITENGATG